MYHAIKKAITDELKAGTRNIRAVTEFKINRLDANDLSFLDESDLVALHFDESLAEKINTALVRANIVPLGMAMGVQFKFDANVPSLLDN